MESYTPGSELLYDLSRKLKVSMDYFFEQISSDSVELEDFKKNLSFNEIILR